MASFDVCYDFMIDNEDPKREYAIVPDAGGMAISGINSKAWPTAFEEIANLDVADRPVKVEAFYRGAFWETEYEQLTSDEIAKRVFDASVNMGKFRAIVLLQRACHLRENGLWGKTLVAGANAIADVVPAFKKARCDYYRAIVAKNPADAKYLQAWLERAMK